MLRPVTTVALCIALGGCANDQPPDTYVLGRPSSTEAAVETYTDQPVIEVKPVLVPEYLDVTELLVRYPDNRVAPVPDARWGERLSMGATRSLSLDLARRVTGVIITATAPTDPSEGQILVEFETFEARADGVVVLVARWRLLDRRSGDILASERVTLRELYPVPRETAVEGAEVVSAMTRLIQQLADRIATQIHRSAAQLSAEPHDVDLALDDS
ncbi:PqiC family protein [uncultured Jannaschia sp.]|uniref:PqiC family protein n=1 Tax=uncultured Jannaschia sp. TaxID=293347 RepID=UPI0026120C82|nr:PqiC family protein [uncultured Jannaschia sp.]